MKNWALIRLLEHLCRKVLKKSMCSQPRLPFYYKHLIYGDGFKLIKKAKPKNKYVDTNRDHLNMDQGKSCM